MIHIRALTLKTHKQSRLLNIYLYTTDLNSFRKYVFLDDILVLWHPLAGQNQRTIKVKCKCEVRKSLNCKPLGPALSLLWH